MQQMKSITLTDFLTSDQIKQAETIFNSSISPSRDICEKVIKPNIEEINRKLGQENDPSYLAYACEYVLSKTKGKQ